MRRRHQAAPRGVVAAVFLILATGFLLALFMPDGANENHRLVADWGPPVQILIVAAALALLALSGLRLPRGLRLALSVVILLAALIHLADALMPGLFGRELDLYWDLGHVPSLLGLFFQSAGPWRGGLIVAAAGGIALAALAFIDVALWTIEWASRRRDAALALIGLPIIAVSLGLPRPPEASPVVSTRLSHELAQQGRFLYRASQGAQCDLR